MKTQSFTSPRHLSDSELIDRVKHLVCRERQATASLVAHLAEMEERQLHVAEGCASLFIYCTQVLHLSEHAAYGRIEAARLVRKFPHVLEKLSDGSVHLTAVGLLAPHLTHENHRDLLDEAAHKTRRQVEEIVARLRPRPPVATSIRRLPAARNAEMTLTTEDSAASPAISSAPPSDPRSDLSSLIIAQPGPATNAGNESDGARVSGAPAATPRSRRTQVEPLAPETYRVQFTADAEIHELVLQARELLRHQIPDGDAAEVFRLALRLLVGKLKQQKFGARKRPAPAAGTRPAARTRPAAHEPVAGSAQPGQDPRSRYIAADVRLEVWERDQGRCAFVSRDGRRCTERGRLEFHHLHPFSTGGQSTAGNLQLRCRTHHRYESRLCFGPPASRRGSPATVNHTFELGSDPVGVVQRDIGDADAGGRQRGRPWTGPLTAAAI